MNLVRVCAGCGVSINALGTRRRFCSERCRKAQYSRPCSDCGKPLSGCNGRGPNAPTRCATCSAAVNNQARRIWTRETVVAAIRDWNDVYGEPPAAADWNPWQARHEMHDDARARRYEDANGRWPSLESVYSVFGPGGWNIAMRAAGFEPRPAHGGGGNELRFRRIREQAAA